MSEDPGSTLCVRCREHPAEEDLDGLPMCKKCSVLARQKCDVTRVCPVDGTEMFKEVLQNLLIDRCPDCGGIWLDHDELEALLRLAAERTDDQSFLNGVLLGMAW